MSSQPIEKIEGLWIQKFLSLVLFLPMVWFLNPETVLITYIVLGHAHFGLTYWYQYKAGRVKPTVLTGLSYIALLAALFWLAFNQPIALLMFVSVFFVLHYYLDEFKMNQERLRLGLFVLVLPFLYLLVKGLGIHEQIAFAFYQTEPMRQHIYGWDAYLGHHPMAIEYLSNYSAKFALQPIWGWVFGLFALGVIYYAVDAFRKKVVSVAAVYILAITAAAIAILWFGSIRQMTSVFGLIVLSHVGHWYISVHQKLKRFAPQRLKGYYLQVALANAIAIGLYFYAVGLPEAPLAGEIERWGYNFHAFMVWTALHLITTIRADDYAALFGKAGKGTAKAVQAVTRFRS